MSGTLGGVREANGVEVLAAARDVRICWESALKAEYPAQRSLHTTSCATERLWSIKGGRAVKNRSKGGIARCTAGAAPACLVLQPLAQ
jgi:hypothetical protein